MSFQKINLVLSCCYNIFAIVIDNADVFIEGTVVFMPQEGKD